MSTDWYKDAVIYQIWPRSFCDGNGDGIGDLYGVYSRLDYIKSLGVDAIWFSPLYPSPNFDYGYDVSDYRAINPEFGDMEIFRRVLDGAGVQWQMTELGKVDQGGGGTVAMFMGNRNIDTIDAGVPVISMHAPFEVVAKYDCYMTYRCMLANYLA